MDDLVKLENKMASKEDLKGMAIKEDLQDLKELMKDIKHRFIPHVSTQEEDNKKKRMYSSHFSIKLKNNWRVGIWSPQKLMIHYKVMGSIQVQGTNLSPRLT